MSDVAERQLTIVEDTVIDLTEINLEYIPFVGQIDNTISF